jgi:hypothetical protein
MNIGFCHIIDPQNIGDLMSCPARYLKAGDGESFHVFSVWDRNPPTNLDVLIFGGGGMFHPNIDIRILDHHRKAKEINPDCKTIIWGIGSNYHDRTDGWPDWLKELDLIGIRDVRWPPIAGKSWCVTCASCLDRELLTPSGHPQHEFVGYWQYRLPIPECDFPWLTNEGPIERWPEVAAHLRSGATVITNSFHGAYWACCFGRRAVIYRPFSSRFTQGLPTASVMLSLQDSTIDFCKSLSKNSQPMPPQYHWLIRLLSKQFLDAVNGIAGTQLELLR